jgi:hypothetical protein
MKIVALSSMIVATLLLGAAPVYAEQGSPDAQTPGGQRKWGPPGGPTSEGNQTREQARVETGKDGPDNHGQVVSECNHRANDRKLKGQERHDFVEWCTDATERHGFDDQRWHEDRACYEQADRKHLSGDARRNFVRGCVEGHAKSGQHDTENGHGNPDHGGNGQADKGQGNSGHGNSGQGNGGQADKGQGNPDQGAKGKPKGNGPNSG